MDKAKSGLSKNKGIHILSLALVAAELSILVPVKEIEDKEGWGRLIGLARPCRGVDALGEEGGHVKAGRAQRSVGASSVPQADLPMYVFWGWDGSMGGPHLIGSTRETHIFACKSTPFGKLPLFLMFPKREQPGGVLVGPGLICMASLAGLPAPSSSDSMNQPKRGQANVALAA